MTNCDVRVLSQPVGVRRDLPTFVARADKSACPQLLMPQAVTYILGDRAVGCST